MYRQAPSLRLYLLVAMASGLLSGRPTHLAAQTPGLDIREHVLDNGLRLLVLERPGDPRVACKIFTDFGSIVEIPGQLGAAHFLEHLMFKGTRTLGTLDWDVEAPIRTRIDDTETALIHELNRARNELRERGVFHDFRHAASTPALDSLMGELARLEREASAHRDGGAMMRWYQAYGGTGLTATTEQEYMKFDINLPRERVDLFLRVEADRMVNSVFREFDEERMILVEQRLGDLNRPTTPFNEAMDATAGVVHPVFWPEGYLSDFQQYTRAYERELYEEYFVANNTTLVFVGGVSLEEMIPKVERWFGALPRAPEPARTPAIEPPPDAERRLIWRTTDLGPRVDVRHRIPGVGHPDRPTIDVLAELLQAEVSDGLRTRRIAGSVDVNTRVVHTTRFGVPSTLNVVVTTDSQATLAAAEAVVLDAMAALADGPVRPAALQAAKKILSTQWARTVANADALAFEIGHFQTMDSWRTLSEHVEAWERSSAEDVQRVAGRYFVPESRTTGIVMAEPEAGR